jgi:hypothetical protein
MVSHESYQIISSYITWHTKWKCLRRWWWCSNIPSLSNKCSGRQRPELHIPLFITTKCHVECSIFHHSFTEEFFFLPPTTLLHNFYLVHTFAAGVSSPHNKQPCVRHMGQIWRHLNMDVFIMHNLLPWALVHSSCHGDKTAWWKKAWISLLQAQSDVRGPCKAAASMPGRPVWLVSNKIQQTSLSLNQNLNNERMAGCVTI